MYAIAADVGGTKTLLAVADMSVPNTVLFEARYQSGEFDGFAPMLHRFIEDARVAGLPVEVGNIDILVLALAGLVGDTEARLTNLPWVIEKHRLRENFAIEKIIFMNDFEASVSGTVLLQAQDRVILNPGRVSPSSAANRATRIALGAGTGLGLAWGDDIAAGEQNMTYDRNMVCTHDTEGGHIDFAPVDDLQIRLLQFLQQNHQHVSYERILSGAGLVSIYQFFSGVNSADLSAEWVASHCSMDESANRALDLFVEIYGAYVGNIALLFKPRAGIFITGGIAAKLAEKMQSKQFIDAYLNKGRMRALVGEIPVYLVTNERIGILGALSQAVDMQHRTLQPGLQTLNLKQQAAS